MTSDNRQPLPLHRDMNFEYGVLQPVAPGLRRLVCNNPGAFTFKGTNCYVVGSGTVAVIDPGPEEGDQLQILAEALKGETVSHIILTHCHGDHSGAAVQAQAVLGGVLCGMPRANNAAVAAAPSNARRSFVIPVPFEIELQHGSVLGGPGWTLEGLHTPGHAPDHLCFFFREENILLSGDHVMGWNTTVVAPPEGNMGQFIASLETLLPRQEKLYFPAHGGPIFEPQRLVKALILHRKIREMETIEGLKEGRSSISDLVSKMYAGIEPKLVGAASLSVLAHLEWLIEKGLVATESGEPAALNQTFRLLS